MAQLEHYVMQAQKTLSKIFQDEPARWGFRVDPFLWREMKATLGDYAFPDTGEQIYGHLTGASLTDH